MRISGDRRATAALRPSRAALGVTGCAGWAKIAGAVDHRARAVSMGTPSATPRCLGGILRAVRASALPTAYGGGGNTGLSRRRVPRRVVAMPYECPDKSREGQDDGREELPGRIREGVAQERAESAKPRCSLGLRPGDHRISRARASGLRLASHRGIQRLAQVAAAPGRCQPVQLAGRLIRVGRRPHEGAPYSGGHSRRARLHHQRPGGRSKGYADLWAFCFQGCGTPGAKR